jgi:tRNA threonylcarbamoyladenosine biosynthesis protein TsaB
MNILALDTSSDCGSVALSVGGERIGEVRLRSSLRHSENLFRSIEFLLAGSRLEVRDVDVFVAARGPGSFTGLRVGMAAAEGMALATGGEALAISTLAALAWQAEPPSPNVAVLIDARLGEVYGALFRRDESGLAALVSPTLGTPAAFLSRLGEEPVVFLGPGVKHCGSQVRAHGSWTILATDPYLAPMLAEMAERGYREPFEPLYLRPPVSAPKAGPESAT